MSDRCCKNCHRPCSGHYGPTGSSCTLKALCSPGGLSDILEEAHNTSVFSEHSDSESEVSMASKEKTTEERFDLLTDQISKLALTVEKLAVNSVPVKAVADTVGGGARSKVSEPTLESGKPLGDSSVRVTTQSLARDRDLAKLLDDYNDGGVADLLFAQDAINQSSLKKSAGEKKVLLIPDFISWRQGPADDDEDSFVTTKGKTFKLEDQKRKLRPGEVTIPQWISANTRIEELLYENFTAQEVKDYRRYVRQLGDLLQLYTSETVFNLDHAHRKEMFVYGDRRWFEIDQHFVNYFLVRARGTGGSAGGSTSGDVSSVDSAGKPKKKKKKLAHPCVRFNSKEGCKYKNNCTFPHICSEPGCMGNHTCFEHAGFRNVGAAKSAGT